MTVRQWRELTRLRKKYVQSVGDYRKRTHKLVESANVKIDSVVSDLFAVTGRNLMKLLIADRDYMVLYGDYMGRSYINNQLDARPSLCYFHQMPRQSRLDAPGVLHHVIIRGIEHKKIFRDPLDQQAFVDRLSVLIPETQTRCYAWVLMSNHAHFLFQSGPPGISTLMRRLLTGYAVSFNRRHKRCGQLFQNRYKSIICQEDAYLKELVRYIHLNPIRAKIVGDLTSLEKYPFCGHGVLAGYGQQLWQDDRYVLNLFDADLYSARERYLSYVEKGLNQGRRPELVGGGLIRSFGGWGEVKKHRQQKMDRIKGDQRILGDSGFVDSMLTQARHPYERGYQLKAKGVDLDYVAEKAAKICGIDPRDIFAKSRIKVRAEARGLLCYWAVNELNMPLSDLARKLTMTPTGVSYAVRRGEGIVRENNLQLFD
jgi:REP element-mobilizing transposase RayT